MSTKSVSRVPVPAANLFTHELLNHEEKPEGIHLGTADRKITEMSYEEGYTSKHITEWYSAQALTDYGNSRAEERDVFWHKQMQIAVNALQEVRKNNYPGEPDYKIIRTAISRLHEAGVPIAPTKEL